MRPTGYPLRGRSSRGRVSLLDIRSPGLLSRRDPVRRDLKPRSWTASLGPASALANRNPRRTLLVLSVQIAAAAGPQ